MTIKKLFFLHNPKAGGASLRITLADISRGSIAPVFGNAPNDNRENRKKVRNFAGHDFYAGHYGFDVYSELNDGHLLMTNFRDPVQRVYSLYRYWKHNVVLEHLDGMHRKDLAAILLAKDGSFSDFIRSEDETVMLYLRNFHFRQILGCPWDWKNLGKSDEFLVKWRIRNMAWFYIAEFPEASTLMLRHAFPEAREITIPNVNNSQGVVDEISQEDVEFIVRKNLFDYSIYSYAVMIQSRRMRKLFK